MATLPARIDTPASKKDKPNEVFDSIEQLLLQGDLDTCLRTWLKWLIEPPVAARVPQRVQYWNVLLMAFNQAESSNHIKFCLAILRKSVSLMPKNAKDDHLFFREPEWLPYVEWTEAEQVADFCHIFEIMVLGRYVNQVNECLHELPRADGQISRLDKVPQVWWLLLFKTVMKSNNDAVKKVIGCYIMEYYTVQRLSDVQEQTRFKSQHIKANSQDLDAGYDVELHIHTAFFDAFLEWACDGQLAYKSVIREYREVYCEHGNMLYRWCERQALAIPAFGQFVLAWLAEHAHELNQHTTIYILKGLSTYVNYHMFKDAIRIADNVRFAPMCRYITWEYCQRIMQRHRDAYKDNKLPNSPFIWNVTFVPDDEKITQLDRLDKFLEHVDEKLLDMRHPDKGDVGIFLFRSEDGYNVDKRAQIAFANFSQKKYLNVDGNRLTIDWERLERFDPHQAMWKSLAESWPIWLTDMRDTWWTNTARDDGQITQAHIDFASECISNFFRLSRKKSYLWATTARNLRMLYLGPMPQVLSYPTVEKALWEFINDPPKPSPEHLLDVAVISSASSSLAVFDFGADETLGHAYIFDMLNRLRREDYHWGLRFLDTLLDPYRDQKLPIPVSSKWKRTCQLQTVILLLGMFDRTPILGIHPGTDDYVEVETKHTDNIEQFLTLIKNDPNPRNRFLFEWSALYLAIHHHDTCWWRYAFLSSLEKAECTSPNAKEIASFIKITAQLVMYDFTENSSIVERAQPFADLLIRLNTLTNSPKVAVRYEAQAAFATVYEAALLKDYVRHMAAESVFTATYVFITKLDKYKNPPESRTLNAFDAKNDMNLATLFEGGYLYVPQSELPMCYAKDFRQIAREGGTDLERNHPSRLPIGEIATEPHGIIESILHNRKTDIMKAIGAPDYKDGVSSSAPTKGPLQTKSLAIDLAALDLEPTIRGNDEMANNKSKKHATGPILIGSLVNAPVNLGGLARAANVFGCHALHVADNTILTDRQFKSVSVDAELHLDVLETPIHALVDRLRELKAQGWKIVGLEQTSDSVVIGVPSSTPSLSNKPSASEPLERESESQDSGPQLKDRTPQAGARQQSENKLPEKSVVIMGAEATGIPAHVLYHCDMCVEIKQWGVTRSLNVQTAAAVILYEWRREWGSGPESSTEPDVKESSESEKVGLQPDGDEDERDRGKGKSASRSLSPAKRKREESEIEGQTLTETGLLPRDSDGEDAGPTVLDQREESETELDLEGHGGNRFLDGMSVPEEEERPHAESDWSW